MQFSKAILYFSAEYLVCAPLGHEQTLTIISLVFYYLESDNNIIPYNLLAPKHLENS